MTATTTETTDGTSDAICRAAAMDFDALQDWARRTRERAEELAVRSAGVLARSGHLQVRLGSRAGSAGREEARGLLTEAETRIANLERALESNRRIGMALGVLMARHQLTEQQAFDVLRLQSSRRNVKLAVLAEQVVYTGGL